jgi:hypothetical protein
VYQKYAESVPTFRFAKGHLTGMKAGDLAHAMLPLAAFDLELQDARHAQVLLKNLDGDFDVTGPIAPVPAKNGVMPRCCVGSAQRRFWLWPFGTAAAASGSHPQHPNRYSALLIQLQRPVTLLAH